MLLFRLIKLRYKINKCFNDIPIDFGGGCSKSKAGVIGGLILARHFEQSIDIGVYRGRSFFPQALAYQILGRGTVTGIDPYSSEDAIQLDNPDLKIPLSDFAKNTNFEQIYLEVLNQINKWGLQEFGQITRSTSEAFFQKIDLRNDLKLVHVDGNHDILQTVSDVESSIPRIAAGGYLILDDVSWKSLSPATQIANSLLKHLITRISPKDDYSIFVKTTSRIELLKSKILLLFITKIMTFRE
jgi:hypothetical protein